MMRKTTILVALLSAEVMAQGLPLGKPRAIASQRLFPASAVALDIDLDGQRDILAGNALALDLRGPFEITVLDPGYKVRAGVSAPPTGETGLPSHPAIVVGRYDPDGLDDIVILSDLGRVSTYINPGPGRDRGLPVFRKPIPSLTLATMFGRRDSLQRSRYFRVQRVDVDGDGEDEIAQCHHVIALFSIVRRSGLTLIRKAGTPAKAKETMIIPGDIRGFASGDFDGDGDLDFCGLLGQRQIVFALQKAGQWSRTTQPTTQPMQATRIAAMDIDGDGRDEVLLAGRQDPPTLWLHFRNGGFGTRLRRIVGLNLRKGWLIEDMLPIDLDGDGSQDLVVLLGQRGSTNARLLALKNTGSGLLRFWQSMDAPWMMRTSSMPIHSHGMRAVDMDHDGDLDILVGGMRDRSKARSVPWIIPNIYGGKRSSQKIVDGNKAPDGRRPTLSFGRGAVLGTKRFSVRLGNIDAGRRVALLLGLRPLRMRLAGLDLVAGPWRSFGTTSKGSGKLGWAEIPFEIPKNKELLQISFRFQWLIETARSLSPLEAYASSGWTLRLRR